MTEIGACDSIQVGLSIFAINEFLIWFVYDLPVTAIKSHSAMLSNDFDYSKKWKTEK